VVDVGRNGPPSTEYLTLDELAADPQLARRLPPDLAWRYHALPLAEDNGRITVALADPDDPEARQAVFAALGLSPCVVKGSVLDIDARLALIWGNEARRPPRLSVCTFPDSLPADLWDYGQAFAGLLGAQLAPLSTAEEVEAVAGEGGHARCDLVLFGKRSHPLIHRLLSRPPAGALAAKEGAAPFALLVARQPRWPIRRILVAICGDSTDDGAEDWTLRLARASGAAVTVLAVVPPVPAMYRGLSRMEEGVAGLLATDTALGRQMHKTARRLTACEVDCTLCLRQGVPDQEIYRELCEGDHDLIVMATRPCPWWRRQLHGDPICSLLSWVDRPVLLAEPTTA
jgi:nucleotide-binding universal stress UspA family protein